MRVAQQRGSAVDARVKPLEHVSMVENVTRQLREAVLRGSLRPGQAFTISQLSTDLGVSHIPIREALRRLEGQGLIELRPARSGVVAPISDEDLSEIYMLRLVLESALVRSAAPLYSPDDLAEIAEALTAMDAEVSDPQSDEFWLWHQRFHWLLLAPAANVWSERLLTPLWHAAERYVRLFYVDETQMENAMAEHHRLCDAAIRRDADLLSRELSDHLNDNLKFLRAEVDQLTIAFTTS